jgi:hypothetical protein
MTTMNVPAVRRPAGIGAALAMPVCGGAVGASALVLGRPKDHQDTPTPPGSDQ